MSDVLAPHTPAERMAVTFARVLRGAGLRVPMGSVLAFVDALGQVGMQDRTCVYWAALDVGSRTGRRVADRLEHGHGRGVRGPP